MKKVIPLLLCLLITLFMVASWGGLINWNEQHEVPLHLSCAQATR
jgi:hypothetical protein